MATRCSSVSFLFCILIGSLVEGSVGDTLIKLKYDAGVSLNGYVILQTFLDTDSFFFMPTQ